MSEGGNLSLQGNGTWRYTYVDVCHSTRVDWQEASLAVLLSSIIIVTLVGNTLIILAVCTTRRLRTVTNCYVLSLAVADCLVAVFVMPPAVALRLMGSWELGSVLCDIWISLDVMCCTASILSLCAISVDRYFAVTQPLQYSRRWRSKKLAMIMILIVWFAAITITCPPIFGWYDSTRHLGKTCRYNQNKGYVVFSAMGSFFIPLIVMLYVYARISCVVAQRHTNLGLHSQGSKLSHKSVIGLDESECLDRGSLESEQAQTSLVNCSTYTSLNGNHHLGIEKCNMKQPSSSSPSCSTKCDCSHHNQFQLHSFRRPPCSHSHLGISRLGSSSRVSSIRRENKTTQTLSIVVGGFVACWLPFFVTYLITPFLAGPVPVLLMTLLTWLGWINSAINPFIYAFYSVDFRNAFWRLTFHRLTKNQPSHHFISQNK